MFKIYVELYSKIKSKLKFEVDVPPEDIPAAVPRASNIPIAIKRDFGRASISLVTIPARYRKNNIEKYIATYLCFIGSLIIVKSDQSHASRKI